MQGLSLGGKHLCGVPMYRFTLLFSGNRDRIRDQDHNWDHEWDRDADWEWEQDLRGRSRNLEPRDRWLYPRRSRGSKSCYPVLVLGPALTSAHGASFHPRAFLPSGATQDAVGGPGAETPGMLCFALAIQVLHLTHIVPA